ncbi:hypothetical protein VF21_06093 [Pseudogymnoascus sp. 05NY08]|nr:hypothetical protein VF21_06093 [Pseudogymnoascus sp. 05NY08]
MKLDYVGRLREQRAAEMSMVGEPATMERARLAREQLDTYDHAIATGRPLPDFFFAHLVSNPRKRSLRSFRYDGSMCTAAMKLDYVRRLRAVESSVGLPAIDRHFNTLEQHIQKLLLSIQKFIVEGGLRNLNQWALISRRNLDVADCAEAAALSTSLPRAVGRRAVAKKSVAPGSC